MTEYDRRVRSAVSRNKIIGSIIIIFSFSWLFCGLVSFMTLLELLSFLEYATPAVSIALMTGLFILSWRSGSKRRKMAKLTDAYWLRIQADPARSVDNLAASLGRPVSVVRQNVQAMIKYGLFPDARLNGPLLILPPYVEGVRTVEAPPAVPAAPAESGRKSTRCPGCGATNSGNAGECEYCGSPLS